MGTAGPLRLRLLLAAAAFDAALAVEQAGREEMVSSVGEAADPA